MKKLLILWNITAAVGLALFVIGCGSSRDTVPLEKHLAETDSLQREINNIKSKDGALSSRLVTLENEKRVQLTRIAELESTVTFLKGQIGRPVAPAAAAPTPVPVTTPTTFSDPSLAYQHALELFRGKQYAQAAQAFQSLLDGGVALKLQDNCRYWHGECLFGAKEYAKAIEDFTQVFAFEKSEKKDESQLMIARSYAKMGKTGQAKIEYQKLIETFPATPYLKQAKEQLAKLK